MNEHRVLQFLFPRLWDDAAGRWKGDASAASISSADRMARWLSSTPVAAIPPPAPGPSPDRAVRAFDEIRAVEVDRRTNFVRLSIRGPTPEIARAWATAMIDELNDLLRRRALEDAHRAVALLSQKVESEPLQSTRVIASALLESQLRHEVSAESRREFALRVLDPPSVPDERYAPRRTRIVLIGAAVGFLLGAMYVVLQAAWRQYRRYHAGAASSGGRAV
jgi:LPS O-antigen subunit length determinant protein (WzzB/FepE family)